MLFQKGATIETAKELTKEQAMEIYGLFKTGLDHTQMFLEKGVPFAYSELVFTEIKRIEAEVQSMMYEGAVKDQKSLVGSITSFLDTETVVLDIVAYSGSYYDDKRSFESYAESFKSPEGI